ncbi:spore coat protein U domain-containing protein [Deinococcus aquaticus]|uniref:Spore coat protein U/FanG domain-containing protein n=1 Tax=Deinococcus aquaticus TaxID=328692 RepID=A0ABY7V5D5_9DEIO|nr:hypothetical protein [Deinococcus aquaticus]WDA60300.1 hypothetical protein M8445_16545 [Deinococcus aquaticus]
MHLNTVPFLLAATLLSGAVAASPANAPVAVNATVTDACEITAADQILFNYQAATSTAATGSGKVSVRCNLDSSPFLGYWDDTQWNANGSIDLMNGANKLNVVLTTDIDPTLVPSNPADGSRYTYGLTATAAAQQWTAPNGSYSAVVDYYIGW